ncbi:MAG TPA: ATP-binding cassette domain-containing protein, partial [Micromonosporaceae bacterium]|nr:ATP-binding cassette domain-containing protein [Micromonosporaceae bacterium]
LLRLVAGELTPARGSVQVTGELGYLPQDLALDARLTVEGVLGIAEVHRALRAIERGDVTAGNLATVGDAWDIEEAAQAILDRLGLDHVDLDRRVGDLSGGEAVLLGLAARLLRRPDVLLLDEPTNNLDRAARQRLYAAVADWRGVLLIVSHDRELLDLADQIVELRDGEVRSYGGSFTAYEEAVAVEQEAAERVVRAAESDVRRQQRDLIEARTKLDRRRRYGQKMADNKREPKIVMGARKRQAQVFAGKHRTMHLERLARAREQLDAAEAVVRDADTIRIDLPGTAVPTGRTVLALNDVGLRHGGRVDLDIRGPERIALVGPNGAGKTTLLRTIAGQLSPVAGQARCAVPLRYLPQRLDVLDERLSVAGNVAGLAPDASDNAVRARLARFLFRGTRADQPVSTLSGGERFRATLAALLLAEPPPQLLLLDEPTNNLDLASTAQLADALGSYAGALIVASHDMPFLRSIAVTRWLRLADDRLTEVDPM